MTWRRIDGLRTLALGEPGPERARFTELVTTGRKQVVDGLLKSDYLWQDEIVERVGELLVVMGDEGERLGVAEVTDVEIVPFGDVSDSFARRAGEGFSSRAEWAEDRQTFWGRYGLTADESSEVVCVSIRWRG